MRAHVLLKLLKSSGTEIKCKAYQAFYLSCHAFYLFGNKLNFNNKRAGILDSIYQYYNYVDIAFLV